ncbi:MAG: nucleotidyltransferase domain-containing protein [Magnetococcus sp. YQC-5]
MFIALPLIETMVNRIVDEVHPDRIILFGSHARGDARPDSDIDLLVVSDETYSLENSRRAALGRLYQSLARLPLPSDILLFSRVEVEYWMTSLNHVIGRAMREGKILYERP